MQIRIPFCTRLLLGSLLPLALFALVTLTVEGEEGSHLVDRDTVYETELQKTFYHPTQNAPSHVPTAASNVFQELHAALEVMQTEYFSLWLGKWTTAIDWTAAVMGTHLSAALSSLSRSLPYTMPGTFDKTRKLDVEAQMVENEINKYFGQSVTYYFGEDLLAIRNQAFDDMLWVVLGWLGSIQFINAHSKRHYPPSGEIGHGKGEWHGKQFIPAFAHRARVFYELAEHGWDWRLCGGGMTWNPRLLPYKNAITNELFISASISMYLHFPGDSNCSPFTGAEEQDDAKACAESDPPLYDPIYLANAINGYDWLANIGMTNDQGLYVDGFHIKDYESNHSNTECNERNEMVYTYNQGVILSGLRGLWEATGNITYLEDGHELVRNVILATGWTKSNIAPSNLFGPQKALQRNDKSRVRRMEGWAGLGAHGILTELCDPSGTCNQNGQTFKGIFFHHLTAFCTLLPTTPVRPGKTHAATKVVAQLHRRSCAQYAPWVVHNAQAAVKTRDRKGRFGAWWGAHMHSKTEITTNEMQNFELLPDRAIDYRNHPYLLSHSPFDNEGKGGAEYHRMASSEIRGEDDPNDRGRGRTVETQGGGVAVVRAMWEFLRRLRDEELAAL